MLAQRYLTELPPPKALALQRVCSTLALAAMILVYISFSFGQYTPTIWQISQAHHTSWTPNTPMTLDLFPAVLFLCQLLYLAQLLASKNEALLASATNGVSYHFVGFGLLEVAFIVLWVKQHFVWCVLVQSINLAHLIILYRRLGPTPYAATTTNAKNLYVQIPTVKLPIALCTYNIVHALSICLETKHVRRSPLHFMPLAVIGLLMLLAVFRNRDALLGLPLSYLLFSLGTEQYRHPHGDHVTWIMAFSYASLLLVLSIFIGVPRLRYASGLHTAETPEQRPLLS
ncbi:hypothetical protein BCR37DRAFT_395549 [Protomyces lactucae-debilis]|uniref:Uncharacterized protein n=1 Tax=Protomyces lactucae-debilis TaxID=2754530 RepID=A0A1Y2EV70_PROLT|nr:uncharacterized protein BCR37DRAFT_395549 [Protomyces lactucae-debilis]ORY75449.1 hypothetical protein BCR37DRAFT_395549 [Protomyces lactucae-debilis]